MAEATRKCFETIARADSSVNVRTPGKGEGVVFVNLRLRFAFAGAQVVCHWVTRLVQSFNMYCCRIIEN